jgi:hypothetical protein
VKNEKQKVRAVENCFQALKNKIDTVKLPLSSLMEIQTALDACTWSINELTEDGERRNQEHTVVAQILKNSPPGPLVASPGQLVVRGGDRRVTNPAGRKNYNQRRRDDTCRVCPRDDCDKSCPCYDEK